MKSEKIAAALRASADLVKKNLELVRLVEVPCEFAPEKLEIRLANTEKLMDLFRVWGFKGMLRELMDSSSENPAELF